MIVMEYEAKGRSAGQKNCPCGKTARLPLELPVKALQY